MSFDKIQAELNAFYKLTLDQAGFEPKHLKELSLPHLLCVSQEYLDAQVRVMFVGKETNGWYGRLSRYYDGTCSISDLLGRYRDQMSEAGGHGAFLHSLDRIAHEFTGATRNSIIWANLMKMDWYQGRKDGRNSVKHSEQLRYFSRKVLCFEVGLLEPDIILFGTGGTRPYDDAIKDAFPNRSNSLALVRKALWRFDIENIACCRLRHPQARVDVKHAFEPTRVYYDRAFMLLKSRITTGIWPECTPVASQIKAATYTALAPQTSSGCHQKEN